MATRTSASRTRRPPRRALSTYTSEPEADETSPDDQPTPRWPSIAGLVVCAAGLAVATYLTIQHFDSSIPLSCPTHGIINCEKVTQSSYSKILGIPVAVLGLVFFVVMAVLQLPGMWRSPRREVRLARLGWSVVGMGTAVWLVYAELFRIDNICLWCTSVHGLTLIIFGITAFGTVATAPPPPHLID